MIVTVDHPERGPFITVGCPIKLSDSAVTVESSPRLGQHNDQIFGRELGLDADRLDELRRRGVI
jgi:formyl-CoA transferase